MKHIKLVVIFFTLTLILQPTTIFADDESFAVPYVSASPNGHFYFKMIPEGPLNKEDGEGVCYQVLSGDRDQVFWRTKGWYANRVYLTHDGKYLVRFGNWPRGHELSDKHTAIAFYYMGKLIREYSTKDLVKNPSKLHTSTSHYFWHKGNPDINVYQYQFKLTTIDDIEYQFDIKSGDIVLQTQL